MVQSILLVSFLMSPGLSTSITAEKKPQKTFASVMMPHLLV